MLRKGCIILKDTPYKDKKGKQIAQRFIFEATEKKLKND
jgi:hypothetical protein